MGENRPKMTKAKVQAIINAAAAKATIPKPAAVPVRKSVVSEPVSINDVPEPTHEMIREAMMSAADSNAISAMLSSKRALAGHNQFLLDRFDKLGLLADPRFGAARDRIK